jgi:hypothetical protein
MLFDKSKNIPAEILPELRTMEAFTAHNKKEISATFCRKPGSKRVFVANHVGGDEGAVESLDCATAFGTSERIGDTHTHPTDADTIGILPSQDDIFTTLVDSFNNNKAQVSCITNSQTPLIECYRPKGIPTRDELDIYRNELHRAELGDPGFYVDHMGTDFDIEFYDRTTGKHVPHPKASLVVQAAFGNSKEVLRKNVTALEHTGFCEYVRAFTAPRREDVSTECVRELRKEQILGFIDV